MDDFEKPVIPFFKPMLGDMKLREMEDDYSYLQYLYPQISRKIHDFVEEQCDRMEYEGSLMFDDYPDKTSLQLLASVIQHDVQKKYPDAYEKAPELLRDMIEVILFHEIMYRRSRYRSRKRLYF